MKTIAEMMGVQEIREYLKPDRSRRPEGRTIAFSIKNKEMKERFTQEAIDILEGLRDWRKIANLMSLLFDVFMSERDDFLPKHDGIKMALAQKIRQIGLPNDETERREYVHFALSVVGVQLFVRESREIEEAEYHHILGLIKRAKRVKKRVEVWHERDIREVLRDLS